MPPGETDKHLFELEAQCKKLEALEKAKLSVKDSLVVLGKNFRKLHRKYNIEVHLSLPVSILFCVFASPPFKVNFIVSKFSFIFMVW